MKVPSLILSLCFLMPFSAALAQKPMRVAMVVPNEGTAGEFWHDFPEIAQVAARKLGCELTVHPASRWPGGRIALIENLLHGPKRPDYLITTIHMGMRTQELEIAEKAKVPVFLVNAGLLEDDLKRVGGPRRHFKHWIGQMLPDEEAAGHDLAEVLIRTAKAHFGDKAMSLLGFGGRETDWPARERNKGLMKAISEHKDVELARLVTANYMRSEAEEAFPLMLKRYPKVSLVWGANDPMILGAMSKLQGTDRVAGKDVLFGGIDWDPKALQAIRDKQMVVSLGGHLFDGAWVMVLLYDYHQGLDFSKERVDWRSRMVPITSENVERALRFFKDKHWSKVDFRIFSKSHHPELKKYNFNVEMLFKQ